MSEISHLNVYDLPIVDNVCNQILREVMSINGVSFAHVTMDSWSVSLLHQHLKMSEVYLILSGNGILYHGDKALETTRGTYLVIPPETPHKLRNTGSVPLEHLVFAVPPFDPSDVRLLEDNNREPTPQKTDYYANSVTALDGATVYELLLPNERKDLGIGLAIGSLPLRKDAIPHYHKKSEEVYYVISGRGKVKVDERIFEVQKGSAIYIPKNAIHGLQNSTDEKLEVLCLSSPFYTHEDFIISD